MLKLVGLVLHYMPLIFGIGFLAPLIAQVVERSGLTLPYGVAPLAAGLVIGGLWGAHAQFRGRWI
jgi:hypothetical protein